MYLLIAILVGWVAAGAAQPCVFVYRGEGCDASAILQRQVPYTSCALVPAGGNNSAVTCEAYETCVLNRRWPLAPVICAREVTSEFHSLRMGDDVAEEYDDTECSGAPTEIPYVTGCVSYCDLSYRTAECEEAEASPASLFFLPFWN